MANQWRKLSSAGYGYSLARLALNASLYFDVQEDPEFGMTREEYSPLAEKFIGLLERFCEGEKPSEMADEAFALREACKKETETVIEFLDNFRVYEYVLNRMERRYSDDLSEIEDTEEFVRRLLHFIMDTEDGGTINQRIQMVVRELPIRMTRQKYYSILRDSLAIYQGADKKSFDQMMSFLRSASLLGLTEEEKNRRPEFTEFLNQLSSQKFSEMSKEVFLNLQKKLENTGLQISKESDSLHELQDMINDFCVICLCKESAVRDAAEEQHAGIILKAICESWNAHSEIPEEIFDDQMDALEGVQEEYFEKYMRMDFKEDAWEDQKQKKQASYVQNLLSSSSFALLETDDEAEKELDKAMLDRSIDEFITEADPLLKSLQKPVSRAVMSGVLSIIPFAFNSSQDLFEYIKNSLDSCTDYAEKAASMELLEMMMDEEEDYDLL